MCSNPLTLDNGATIGCNHCNECKEMRVHDFVGRCIAEQSTSAKVVALTLTYRSGNPGAGQLIYSDAQKFIRRLRKAGYPVRYVITGEYGSHKGRAHWHCILFFSGPYPELGEFDKTQVTWKWWPHGYTYFQNAEYRGFKYLLKYVLKDTVSDSSTRNVMMSKKPPLGYDYFMTEAFRIASQQLPVRDCGYEFDWVRTTRSDKPRKFFLRARMQFLFLEEYDRIFRVLHGKEPPQTDFICARYYDPIAKAEMANDPKLFESVLAHKEKVRNTKMSLRRAKPFMMGDPTGYLTLVDRTPHGLITSWPDGTVYIDLSDEGEPWRIDVLVKGVVNAAKIEMMLLRTPLPRNLHASVCRWLLQPGLFPGPYEPREKQRQSPPRLADLRQKLE